MSHRRALLACICVALGAAAAIAATPALVDEQWHLLQVRQFLRGQYAPIEELTQIPGLHALVALVEWVLHSESLAVARAVTTAFAVLAIPAFAGIRRAVAPADDPTLPTLQFLFFPLSFPFCFLFYTDVPSVTLVLWSLRCSLVGRHRVAGLFGFASLLVRQNNIVWIAFIALLQIAELRASYPAWGARLRAAGALWPYAVSAAAFAAFWLWNGSISLSPVMATLHPDLRLHAGNVYFMLFMAAVFLLPLLPVWLPSYVRAARSRPSLLLVPVLLGALYPAAFVVDHPYNLGALDYFLRNSILVYIVEHEWAHVGFGVIALVAACALTQVPWHRASFVLLLPSALLFVSFSWLIEQRYYLIPFALLLALRVPEDRRVERILLALWIPVAVGFFYGIVTLKFFL